MKRILYVLLALVFVFALTACGNDLPATVDPEVDGAAAVDVTETEETESTEYNPAFSCDGDPITAFGGFTGYDRFSGEQVGGAYIYIHDSDSEKVVFNYTTSRGTFKNLTAYLDSSLKSTVYITDTCYLDMTFTQATIYVDEIEGMGAMAYDFKH